ncbi:MAG: phytanoyl-CoA dioxygenase family protein [Gammaproteobacteria bacterium]|nr:phytanoyl-CoA dioxygenase family protein [Gammaproteobacteria bacterium]
MFAGAGRRKMVLMCQGGVPVADDSSGVLSARDIAAYQEDGAAVIRGVVPTEWISRMRIAVDRILGAPGSASVEYTPAGNPGRYYGDFFVWMRDADFRAFAFDSPLPMLAAQLMGARRVSFFYDQLLVKEPGTLEPTPPHQDLPYWPVRGEHIVSFWVPFDPVRDDSGTVQYVQGSHRWGRMYAPAAFGDNTGFQQIYERAGFAPMPAMAELIKGARTLRWQLEPGDIVVHHPLTVHFSEGNRSANLRRRALALRYLGDDACFDARPGTFLENPKVRALFTAPEQLNFTDGQPLINDSFPQVLPRR